MSDTTRNAVIDALVTEAVHGVRLRYIRALHQWIPLGTEMTAAEMFEIGTGAKAKRYITETRIDRAATKLWLERAPHDSPQRWQSANPRIKGGVR